MPSQIRVFKLSTMLAALVGAFLLAILQAAFNYRDFASLPPQAWIGSIVAGFVVGWVAALALDLHGLVNDAQQRMGELSKLLEYQEGPLKILIKSPRHHFVLSLLLQASIYDKYRLVPYVSTTQYLDYLNEALKNSDTFQGVQRNPVRWFQQQAGEDYLRNLRERRMSTKTRIFIVDDVQAMQEDLADAEVMRFYWKNTGDIRTFWISSADFQSNFPGVSVPKDFALFDRELLIQYESALQTLRFDRLTKDAPENNIFELLEQQLRTGMKHPFIEIEQGNGAQLRSVA